MKKLLILSLFVNFIYANDLLCFRFESSNFTSEKSWNTETQTYTNIPKSSLAPVYIAFIKSKDYTIPPYIFTRINNKTYDNKYLSFFKKTKYTLVYNGECDSAYLTFHKNKGLQLFSVELSHSKNEQIHSFMLTTKDKEKWLIGKTVKCPSYAYRGKYVCYDKRSSAKKPEYTGCIRSLKTCQSINKKHFGHYSTEEATHKALFRCYLSNPKFVSKK